MSDEMNNEQAQNPEEQNPEEQSASGSETEGPSTDELFEEVQRLGARFAAVVQTAWDSDERRQIEGEVRKGLSAMASGVEEGFRKVNEDERARDVVDQADDVMTSVGDKVRSSQVTNDLAGNLASGLRKVSDTLSKWVEEQSTSKADESDQGSNDDDGGGQDIPIDLG